MPKKTKQPGAFTLFELMVAVAIIAMMVAVALPASRSLRKSYESTGAESMINAAFSTARALAAKEQKYVGVRFQQNYDPNANAILKSPQYMVFIIHDQNATGLAKGFRAYQPLRPIKLPANIGVMDLKIRTDWANETKLDNQSIKVDVDIKDDKQVMDTTTFSVVFSPSGKMIITDVRVRNKNGKVESGESNFNSDDQVFNTITKITNTNPQHRFGMLAQDDYAQYGLGGEYSRSSFVIYDRERFKVTKPASRWTDYLQHLKVYNINGYTGTIIETK